MNNYSTYLQRMTDSCNISSKHLILDFVSGNKVLDVGCGSGVLLEQLKNFNAEGIDLNPKSVSFCTNKGLTAHHCALHDVRGKFDTIIFSSVLHEFSSYDKTAPYTQWPIEDALHDAYNHLNVGGKIIIRDGIKAQRYDTVKLHARKKQVIDAFRKYLDDAPMFYDRTFKVNQYVITADAEVLKEFLFTYTWGTESYEREVNEQYGILTEPQWLDIVSRAGFAVEFNQTYEEEYVKYLSKHFYPTRSLKKLLSNSTMLIVGKK